MRHTLLIQIWQNDADPDPANYDTDPDLTQ
jgi:hypothetical protein